MKHIYQTILIGLSLLAAATTVRAQDVLSKYKEGGGVATSKTVGSQNEDGSYTITLETFATGTSTLVTTSKPVDVVLVLDYSGSMNQTYSGSTSKLEALQDAVSTFIDKIAENDAKDENGDDREENLGNRIAIVTYASVATNLLENNTYAENGGFVPVDTQAKINALKNAVYDADTGTGTQTGLGMSTGTTLIGNSKTSKPNSSRVIVLFTDGIPQASRNDGFTESIANTAISAAYTAKHQYDATVYSVGLITGSGADVTNGTNMLHYVSSNYPDAQSMTDYGDALPENKQIYYYDANDEEMDLSAIFAAIAIASGGSSETVGASTQVRDVVSSSFTIAFPSTVTTAEQKQAWIGENVKVYTSAISEDGKSWGTEQEYSAATVTYYTTTANGETYDAINVEGFDYSLADDPDQSGNGNWVGLRYRSDKTTFYAGKKLIIKFNVTIEDGITGGITGTNIGTSGVYLKNEETGEYTCINAYEIPNKVLSITIKISKKGLRSGESATFLINRYEPLKEDGKIVYNAIGKPEKGAYVATDHKVILTNKSATNGEEVIKTMYGLDPNYVYEVVEDDWGWAYEMTGTGSSMTTSSVTINPFKFTNTEKTEIGGKPTRKHAEAVTINHFGYTITGGEFEGKQEEHYKSSKTKF